MTDIFLTQTILSHSILRSRYWFVFERHRSLGSEPWKSPSTSQSRSRPPEAGFVCSLCILPDTSLNFISVIYTHPLVCVHTCTHTHTQLVCFYENRIIPYSATCLFHVFIYPFLIPYIRICERLLPQNHTPDPPSNRNQLFLPKFREEVARSKKQEQVRTN